MLTNRQWLESLTDKQLAEFLTRGILVRNDHFGSTIFPINIHQIAGNYMDSVLGIEKWLKMPQTYEVEEGGIE